MRAMRLLEGLVCVVAVTLALGLCGCGSGGGKADSGTDSGTDSGLTDGGDHNPGDLGGDPSGGDPEGGDLGGDPDGGDPGGGDPGGFWPQAYDPGCAQASGGHSVGQNCLQCHGGEFSFAGSVFTTGGTGVANVEVGIRDSTGFLGTCSASTGNFFIQYGRTVDWGSADVRLRDQNGELQMPSQAQAGCNSCHTGTSELQQP